MDLEAMNLAKGLIRKHEGFRANVYRDSRGFLTLGIGHCLETNPITEKAGDVILEDDLDWFVIALQKQIPYFNNLLPARQAVLIDMAFNLGLIGIMKFLDMWDAIEHDDWDKAANAMLDSQWSKQVGMRAIEDANIMRTGKIDSVSNAS